MKQSDTIKRQNTVGQTGHWTRVVLNFGHAKIYYIDSLGNDNAYIHLRELADFSLKLMNAINDSREKPLIEDSTFEYVPTQGATYCECSFVVFQKNHSNGKKFQVSYFI